jgi:hypothetical protein
MELFNCKDLVPLECLYSSLCICSPLSLSQFAFNLTFLLFFFFSMRYISCRLCLGAWSDHGERTGGFMHVIVTKRQSKNEWYTNIVPFFSL